MNEQFNGQQIDGAALAVGIVFYLVIFAVAIAVQIAICYVLYRAASAIPEQQREASPGQAFFLLIPLFNIYWLFVYPKKLSISFQRVLSAGGQSTDDCGEKTGLWWAICTIASIVPCVGIIAGLAGLVLMIMYLVKVSECRTRVLAMGNKGFNTPQFYGQKF